MSRRRRREERERAGAGEGESDSEFGSGPRSEAGSRSSTAPQSRSSSESDDLDSGRGSEPKDGSRREPADDGGYSGGWDCGHDWRMHPRYARWRNPEAWHGHGYWHGHRHGPRHPRRGVFRYVYARLHRRLFLWFGVSILAAGAAAMAVLMLSVPGRGVGGQEELERLRTFTSGRFAAVWNQPAERDALAAAIARDLALDVRLEDGEGRVLSRFGQPCTRREGWTTPVTGSDGQVLGALTLCAERHGGGWRGRALLPLWVALAILWAASGRIARRMTRPLGELARVAQELGRGKLSTRAQLHPAEGEVGILAEAMNEMAERIERQIADQRELLAAVSHELRTPLGHLRLLAELAREGGGDPKALDELDREVVEIDALVGQLLAHSRLDFQALTYRPLEARDLATRGLERAGLDPALLSMEGAGRFEGDATLISRALANLIQNAQTHGKGLRRLRVRQTREGWVAFEAEDGGPGFGAGEEERIFQPYYRGKNGTGGSLGLGLSLVMRTAQAHGGRAYAGNLPEGGARVGFEIPQQGA